MGPFTGRVISPEHVDLYKNNNLMWEVKWRRTADTSSTGLSRHVTSRSVTEMLRYRSSSPLTEQAIETWSETNVTAVERDVSWSSSSPRCKPEQGESNEPRTCLCSPWTYTTWFQVTFHTDGGNSGGSPFLLCHNHTEEWGVT